MIRSLNCHASMPNIHKSRNGFVMIKCPVCQMYVYGAGEEEVIKKWNDYVIDLSFRNLHISNRV